MGRKRKQGLTTEQYIERLYKRGFNQELAGQTKQAHYHATKDKMVECSICNKIGVKLHRHRIIPGTEYTDDNIAIVCVPCHKLIHRILDELGSKDYYFNCKFAIELAKQEVRRNAKA